MSVKQAENTEVEYVLAPPPIGSVEDLFERRAERQTDRYITNGGGKVGFNASQYDIRRAANDDSSRDE